MAKIKRYKVGDDIIYLVTVTEAVYHKGQLLSTILDKVDALLEGNGGNVVTGIRGEGNAVFKKGNVTLTKDDIGLGNVSNESKESILNNARLTGIPSAPTPEDGDSSERIATTAFVQRAIENMGPGGGGGTNFVLLSEYEMRNLTAEEAVEGVIYLSLEGFGWRLGDGLPMILT